MSKTITIAAQTKASLQDVFKCGSCLHFKQTAHRSFEKPCSGLGIRAFAIAPKCFTPDYTKVITNTDEFVALAALFNSKTPEQKKIILGMLRQQPKGKKLRMGTKLYLNFRGREYVSNYVCGYVVGYTSGGDIVLTGSPDMQSRGRAFFAYLKSDESLLTQKEWKTRYLAMRKKGCIQDPTSNLDRDITARVEDDTYEVPTIDNAPKSKVKVVKLNKRTTSLVKLISF
jgi:hypothetical protein